MKKTRNTPNRIITKLRKVETARAEGHTVADRVRDIGVSEQILPMEAGIWHDASPLGLNPAWEQSGMPPARKEIGQDQGTRGQVRAVLLRTKMVMLRECRRASLRRWRDEFGGDHRSGQPEV